MQYMIRALPLIISRSLPRVWAKHDEALRRSLCAPRRLRGGRGSAERRAGCESSGPGRFEECSVSVAGSALEL